MLVILKLLVIDIPHLVSGIGQERTCRIEVDYLEILGNSLMKEFLPIDQMGQFQLGVTGSIAAIKAENLVKRLKGIGRVIVVMTEAAREFVAPEELAKASDNRVVTDLFERYRKEKESVEHISLAGEADLLLIAPATANIISKLANGIADDMLSTLALATQVPILIVPAMNTDMWENAIIRENVTKLKARGYKFVGPSCGRLASGRWGK
ncbi:unnamed protein product, partial [marine sediment metagenome]